LKPGKEVIRVMPYPSDWKKKGIGLAGKILLSAVAVYGFVSTLQVMQLWYAYNSAARSQAKSPSLAQPDDNLQEGAGFDTEIETFWPHFPGSAGSVAHRMTVNGVDTISENWQTAAAPTLVIDYYKQQMLARGWRETTEESFHLQPERRVAKQGRDGLQDPEFIAKYDAIMSSSLVLNRGNWSIQIMAVPGQQGIRATDIRIFAAATPNIKDFSLVLFPDLKDGADPARAKTIDTVEENGGQRCHTVITTTAKEPFRYFQDALEEYQSKNWSFISVSPVEPGRPEYFACVVKDKAYATLSVRPVPKGQGASVTVSEITPIKDQNR
jgi:hypothetical protein